MRFLVTFAIDAEFNAWKSRHPFVPYDYDTSGRKRDFDMYRANIGAHEITVLLTGMGGASVRKAMKIVPPEMHEAWISTGLAGALDAHLQRGAIVVARDVMRQDSTVRIPGEPDFVAPAVNCGATAVKTFLTAEKIAATAIEKESLQAMAEVVEMESAYILAEAQQRQIPAVAVRSISDVADEDLPLDFQKIIDERGRVKIVGLLKELVLHPHRLPLLIRFGQHSRAAAVSLADFLDRFLPAVAEEARRTSFANEWATRSAKAPPRKQGWVH